MVFGSDLSLRKHTYLVPNNKLHALQEIGASYFVGSSVQPAVGLSAAQRKQASATALVVPMSKNETG